MNTTATWYRGGSASPWEGRVGFNSGALVGRFAFTTPAIGAATLSWVSSSLLPQDETTWSQTEQAYHFRWAVTLSASEHIGRVSNSIGTAVGTGGWGGTTYMHSGGTAAVQMMPNTTYYLWIFPSDSWYNNWLIGSVSVTLGGSYGMPATPSAADGDFGEAVGISLAGSSSGASFTVSISCAGRIRAAAAQCRERPGCDHGGDLLRHGQHRDKERRHHNAAAGRGRLPNGAERLVQPHAL